MVQCSANLAFLLTAIKAFAEDTPPFRSLLMFDNLVEVYNHAEDPVHSEHLKTSNRENHFPYIETKRRSSAEHPNSLSSSIAFRCKKESQSSFCIHYDNTSVQYTAIFHCCKNSNFQMKNSDGFRNLGQNKDRGYTLEPPHRGGSYEYPQSMF